MAPFQQIALEDTTVHRMSLSVTNHIELLLLGLTVSECWAGLTDLLFDSWHSANEMDRKLRKNRIHVHLHAVASLPELMGVGMRTMHQSTGPSQICKILDRWVPTHSASVCFRGVWLLALLKPVLIRSALKTHGKTKQPKKSSLCF